MRVSPRGRCRGRGLRSVAVGFICSAFALLGLACAPTNASAAASGGTFKFSGALKGTLHVTPGNCSSAGGAGSFYSSGKLKGPHTTTGWTITITSLKSGTFKLHQGKPPDVNVSSNANHEWGFNANGTVTIKGNTGKVNTDLSSTNAAKIHITGSWSCPSS
jgi:hypothetical protein